MKGSLSVTLFGTGESFPIDAHNSRSSVLAMSSRPVRWLAVVTLTFVLGGHWAILQSVAWVTMVASYSQKAPLKAALAKTFGGKHPCSICKFVAKGKKAEQKQETRKLLVKVDFFLTPTRVAIYPPSPAPLQFSSTRSAGSRNEAPPTPPPRFV
jgi:hypothetical protein